MSTPSSATTGVAGRYASALFELADNAKSLDQVAQDLVTFRTMVRESADLARLIASPVIGRDLQGKAALSGLLANVLEHRAALARQIPVFLKIAPDLNGEEIADVAEVAISLKIDAIIATNTTLNRDGLKSVHRGETGGLSGAPLFERSTRVLAHLSAITAGKVPLIGVGGIGSAEQAYAKIRAGASAVQLYSALVYGGLSVVSEITRGLDGLLIFRQESMYYLTGYDTFGYCFFQCLVLHADGRMVLLTRAPDLRQARQGLQQQRRLADAGIATDQDHAAGHQTAAKNPIEFLDAGGLASFFLGLDRSQ